MPKWKVKVNYIWQLTVEEETPQILFNDHHFIKRLQILHKINVLQQLGTYDQSNFSLSAVATYTSGCWHKRFLCSNNLGSSAIVLWENDKVIESASFLWKCLRMSPISNLLIYSEFSNCWSRPFQHPKPVQFVSNLFLPGGFELARYADSKVCRVLGA